MLLTFDLLRMWGSVIICAYITWTLRCIDIVQPANCQLFLLFGVQIKLRQGRRFRQLSMMSHQGELATNDGNVQTCRPAGKK